MEEGMQVTDVGDRGADLKPDGADETRERKHRTISLLAKHSKME